MNVVLPCISDYPDHAHDVIVVNITPELGRAFTSIRKAWNAVNADSHELYSLEFDLTNLGPLHYLSVDDVFLAPPDDSGQKLPDYLTEHGLKEAECRLTPLDVTQYLTVVEQGFFFSWRGEYKEHGPHETYESALFTPEDPCLHSTSPS